MSEHKTPLSDRTVYPDSMSIKDLLKLDALDSLKKSSYVEWRNHEYNREGKKVMKWTMYQS
jgi:hypothetical protein